MCCFAVLVLPFLFQVAIMKIFKSSIEYALQNSVSMHSRLFWWKSLIGTALLWFSLASYIVQVSILKLFESFGWLHFQMWCWIFSLWFSMMSPINNVLLLLWSCFLFCSSLSHETVQIFYRICSAKLSFKSFTVVLMDVSYKRSSALVFAGFLYRSSLNTESFREFWKTTLANLMLNFSLLLSLMSPINNVLLCCSRASFSVSSRNHENIQIFYRICSAKLSFNAFTIVLMEVSYRHSAALVFACFLYCSSLNIETLREFRMTTLPNVMLNFFSVVLNDVSYKQCAAFALVVLPILFKSQSWKCWNLL